MKTELREITRDNVSDAVRVEAKPGQSSFVAPVVYSLAEASVQPDVAWPRLVYSDDQPVAFVMGAWRTFGRDRFLQMWDLAAERGRRRAR